MVLEFGSIASWDTLGAACDVTVRSERLRIAAGWKS